jgi:UDP-glucose 4-epimerase
MNFKEYLDNNVFATQRLLEVAKNANLKKFIYASSSSVYGEAEILPTSEKVVPCPFSPYGVTKLAAENLCRLYWKNFGVPTVSLRYFTVYGPRQRPEMAFAKFIKIALQGGRIEIYGNGEQTRDFTFIDDVVEANILAMESGPKLDGEVFNIGGGSRVSVNEVLDLIGRSVGQELEVVYQESQKGDVLHTGAEIRKAKRFLGWQPRVTLQEGILRQVNYLKESDGC